jgi:hypothetical protein
MFEFVLLLIGIAGFGIAGFLDLKTTEFPDYLPYSIIVAALIARGSYSFLIGDFQPLVSGIFIGSVFLSFGLVLYFLKQWGDGDAWLLGAMGFLFPDSGGFPFSSGFPFPLTFLFNFFFISFFYLVAYSIILGVRNRVGRKFLHHLKGGVRNILIVVVFFSAAVAALMLHLHFSLNIGLFKLYPLLFFPPLLAGVMVFVHYGRFIETELFRRRVPASKLSPGDVPLDRKWRVLSRKELGELKRKGGQVWIKEGVRFAPVFLATLLLTLFYGGLFF